MPTLTVTTPHGTFTRTTATPYTHAVVRRSPRAGAVAATRTRGVGVDARWIKDRGFAVTWHRSDMAAIKASAAPYVWDHAAEVLGIYPVDQTTTRGAA